MTENAIAAATSSPAPSTKSLTVGALLRAPDLATRLQGLAPPGYDGGRLIRQVCFALRASPPLRTVTPESLLITMAKVAELGLDLSHGRAYIVPRKARTGATEASLMIGYPGWVALAIATGRVTDISAAAVFEKDALRITLNRGFVVEHSPHLDGDPGAVRGAYAVAELVSGHTRGVWLPLGEIVAIRQKADPNSLAWRDHFPMMAMKTATKRLARILAQTAPLLAAAVAADQTASDYEGIVDVADTAGADDEGSDPSASTEPAELPTPSVDPGPAKPRRAPQRAAPAPIEDLADVERRLGEASTLDAVDLVIDQCRQLTPELQPQIGALANARREALRAKAHN